MKKMSCYITTKNNDVIKIKIKYDFEFDEYTTQTHVNNFHVHEYDSFTNDIDDAYLTFFKIINEQLLNTKFHTCEFKSIDIYVDESYRLLFDIKNKTCELNMNKCEIDTIQNLIELMQR